MAKYRINGLDCAQCANEIETALRKVEGLESSRVSFATKVVQLNSDLEATARQIIARVEPGASLSALGAENNEEHEGSPRHMPRIIVSGLLFALGTIFNQFLHDTPYSVAEYAVLISAYLIIGYPVLRSAAFSLVRGQVFNEMFLMSIATLGALIIHQIPEAVGVMLFYSVGEYFQEKAVDKSRRSIASLMDLRPESARVLVDEVRQTVPPASVTVGSLIEVLPGERIPLDGTVSEGSSFVETSSLTGESVPRRVSPGDAVLAGFVNDDSRLLIRTTKEFGQTAVARILELVEDAASQKAPTEKFISRFAAVYTPIVVIAAALVAFLPPLLLPDATLREWAYRALVLLVISCPCALVISIPLGYFGGIGGASRNKLLIKGANHVDALTKVDTVVFDKTGTLTEGVFVVNEVTTRNGFAKGDLLRWAAAAESHSTHPIAKSIREAAGTNQESATDVTEVKGHGVLAQIGGHRVLVGNDRLLHRENIEHQDCDVEGTVVYIAVDGKYAGYLVISDRIKAEAKGVVKELKSLGVRRTVMLTGDNETTARGVAAQVGVDGFFAELLPEDKVSRLEELIGSVKERGKVVFVGDGMNDAPVLMRSDIGFAMGGLGSDAAIEAADVVVMDDDIGRIPLALRIATFTRRVVTQNIVVAMGVKAVFIGLGAIGVANMWEAVIADVGVALLSVFNAMRTVHFADADVAKKKAA